MYHVSTQNTEAISEMPTIVTEKVVIVGKKGNGIYQDGNGRYCLKIRDSQNRPTLDLIIDAGERFKSIMGAYPDEVILRPARLNHVNPKGTKILKESVFPIDYDIIVRSKLWIL